MASSALALEEDWPRQDETPFLAIRPSGTSISRILAREDYFVGVIGSEMWMTTPVSIQGAGVAYVKAARAVVAEMATPQVEVSGLMSRTFTPSFAVLSRALSPTVTGWNLLGTNILSYGRVADVFLLSGTLLQNVVESIRAYVASEVMPTHTTANWDWISDSPQNSNQSRLVEDPLDATQCLLRWFDLTYEELSAITGVARGTFFYWQRAGARPYRKTLRKLWRAYAVGESVVSRLGERAASEWLRFGEPSPMKLLEEGRIAEVEDRVHSLVFAEPPLQVPKYFAVDDLRPGKLEADEEDADQPPLRRASRRAKRRRLEPS